MNRFQRFWRSSAIAFVAAAAFCFCPSAAEAAFSVRITTTVGVTTINDGGTGDLDMTANNQINFSYTDTAYSVVGSFAFTNTPGTPSVGILDLVYSVTRFGTTGGAGILEASANGFSQPSANPLTLTSTVNGNGFGTGTVSFNQYANTNNILFGQGPVTPGLQGPFNLPNPYGSSKSVQFNQNGLYSLTERISFNLGSNSFTTGDFQSVVTAVPAPASLILAATSLPVLGIGNLFRRRRTNVQ